MTAPASCLYQGWVRHRRRRPRRHEFRYRVNLFYLDLDELPGLFGGRWLWSSERHTPVSFRRADHLGDPRLALRTSVGDLVEQRTGRRCDGPIRLLTHPRHFGFAFNPVSFFFCFDAAGARVDNVVAEVSNTPWGERHCYVLSEGENLGAARRMHHRFPKAFHVSPFMSMDHVYDWRLTTPGRSLVVHMNNVVGGEVVFDATMCLRRREMKTASLLAALARYPLMPAQVFAAVYFEALRLWCKGTPFFAHPRHRPVPRRESVAPVADAVRAVPLVQEET